MVIWRAACLLLVLAVAGTARAEEPLRLGVHPYLPATEIVERFSPLAAYIEKKTGRPVEVVISKDYRSHIDLVGKDGVDIAFMGPASYVALVEEYGRRPLLARLEIKGSPVFQGVIIVRSDSPLKGLKDLAGKRFAFGEPDSTMSHLVPRHMLLEAGVFDKLAGYEFLKGHHNVALGVLVGDFDAGAVKDEVFFEYEPRGLKALVWTPELSEHVFVASRKLPPGDVEAIRGAMLGLKGEPEGEEVMTSVNKGLTALVSASDADYDNLRKILKALEKSGVKP